jgi:hypothetical protein
MTGAMTYRVDLELLAEAEELNLGHLAVAIATESPKNYRKVRLRWGRYFPG